MAKDPAILWYPSDYIGGTSDYTFEEKGAYMEILMKEFEHGGPLPEAKIKRILREKYHAIWEVIREKFQQDENGNWYNERLELERERRKKFTESRRNNLKKKNNPHKDSHMCSHMDTHTGDRMGNGNGNEDGNEDGNGNEDGEGGGPGEVPRGTRENEGKTDETKVEEKLLQRLDELYLDQQRVKWPEIDFDAEVKSFFEKVRGSPSYYANHEDLRLAFQAQLRNAKKKQPNER